MSRTSILRNQVEQFVRQHPAGVQFNIVVHQFRDVGRHRLTSMLYNLRQDDKIHRIRQAGQPGNAIWKGGSDPDGRKFRTSLQAKREKRAQQADEACPLTFYGEGLQPPRCPSVWAYASHFQEVRA